MKKFQNINDFLSKNNLNDDFLSNLKDNYKFNSKKTF